MARGRKNVVTIDFDHTLKFETGKPNMKTVSMVKKLQSDPNNELFVVTSRKGTSAERREIDKFLKKHGIIVRDVVFTKGRDKVNTLMNMNSTLHFDDDSDELKQIKAKGISVIDTFNKREWDLYVDNL